MKIGKTEIADTFAEAFEMWGARIIITADSKQWAHAAAASMTGFATSVIRCKLEAAVECEIRKEDTPDNRPGVSVLLFTMSGKTIAGQLIDRIGQCVMTCPTTAAYNGIESDKTVSVGGKLRFFGDGYQISKVLCGRRIWRIPIMEGEFLIEDTFGIQPAVGGGNLIILGTSKYSALQAATAASNAMREVAGVFLPFPQGVVGSGSKIGSRYKAMIASTNDMYCPTLRSIANNGVLPDNVEAVYEIVVDGLNEEAVKEAMRRGMHAAARKGIIMITAGNYGGKLGKYKFGLHEILNGTAS
ncbi:MAG: formylmethanofuran--tetrahydromethanopterin N-formyltransferase [Gammaproteobacteria bacterium]|nr:formylmethanofuran--tetrahydromethanopterin N-formyltransferase [Gammaproteobacteria bacterium]MDE0412606.1 formylmethanofuran--tetrahydromethanopterin N-formyltransferase [Gammaproteobacteria bacterium]